MFEEYGEEVVLKRAGRGGKHGVKAAPEEIPVDGVLIDWGGTSETIEHREQVSTTATALFPAYTEVRPTDILVRGDGSEWAIKGDVLQHGHGWDLGSECRISRVRG